MKFIGIEQTYAPRCSAGVNFRELLLLVFKNRQHRAICLLYVSKVLFLPTLNERKSLVSIKTILPEFCHIFKKNSLRTFTRTFIKEGHVQDDVRLQVTHQSQKSREASQEILSYPLYGFLRIYWNSFRNYFGHPSGILSEIFPEIISEIT